MKRIVILFSGNGTNLENILQKLHQKELLVAAAITNNPKAKGIERAKKYGIPVEVVDHQGFASREAFDEALVERIQKYRPDLVVLAGFMRILTPVFTSKIKNAINIHPSLLPLFKGARAIERSFASDMKVAGVTVHWVSEELDSGQIIDRPVFIERVRIWKSSRQRSTIWSMISILKSSKIFYKPDPSKKGDGYENGEFGKTPSKLPASKPIGYTELDKCVGVTRRYDTNAVSYTHLTLPTKA